ncbi:MAG: acetylornithine/succinylornithine family transaminase [Planctomycetota bacterium]|jgi:predicted acetylornithine/succinylornithine family transaminase
MTTQEILDLFDKCVIPNYPRQPIVITRAAGSEMWDLDGKRYLDLFPGWGCALLGHCHPRIVEAVRDQVGRLIHMDNIFYTVEQGRLAELIHQHSFGGKSFFSNSGAEANEGAIKLARRHTPPERYKIITMDKSFHGRTLAAMTATGQSKAHQGFGPLMPGFVYVPFNDIDAVAQAIDNETAAVMVEPIQGEGGINVPDDNYLPALRELCDENQMLLILDEVQTGCGRTGKWFGYQHYPIEPDIITLAKALGNGAPIGAIVAQPEVADSLTPGTHASTFGANPLVVSAAIAVLETIEEENLLEKVQQISAYIFQKAGEIQQQFTFIEEVRGRGLMIAIELALPGAPIVTTALEKGLRINCTQETVLRMLPAMTLTDQQVDEAFEILTDSIKEAEKKLVKT